MYKQINIIISGIQGYVGTALLSLVNHHPYLNLVGVHSRQDKALIYQSLPTLSKKSVPIYSLNELCDKEIPVDVIVLATPANVSIEIAAKLAHKKIIILDLSGAFRLSADLFFKWYGFEHSNPDLIAKACYGLLPWVKNQIDFQLIANPGCYATCALMTLIPLFNAGIIKENSIIIDAKSGASGAGKKLSSELMFCETAHNFFPYKIGKHQHTPEINTILHQISGVSTNIRLTTAILPLVSGISMSVYVEANDTLTTDGLLSAAIENAFYTAYKEYPLVHVAEVGKGNLEQDHFILSLKNVVNTPNMHIGFFVQNGQITLFSCIDNLFKGAASQAIENINAIYKLPLHTGLLPVGEE